MASLLRVLRLGTTLSKCSPTVRQAVRLIPRAAFSSTSKKVEQSEFVVGKQTEFDPARVEEIIRDGTRLPSETDASDPTYVNHGFDDDPYWDTWAFKGIFFATISFMMVFGPLVVHYMPDTSGREWALREANIVLEERRANGQPVIDPDFIDPSKLLLPEEDPEPIRTA